MEAKQATTRPSLSFGEKLLRETKRLLFVALLVLVGLLIVKHYGFDHLNEEIRLRVENSLRKSYPGLDIQVKSARRIEGKGVEIRGVTICEGAPQGETGPLLLSVDEIFATCDTRLPDFVTKPPEITKLAFQRVRVRAERHRNGVWCISNLLPLPPSSGLRRPVVTVSDAELEVIDARQSKTGTLGLRQLEFTLTPAEARPELKDRGSRLPNCLFIQGKFAGDHLQQVSFQGEIDPEGAQFRVQGEVEGFEFNPRLRSALPREVSAFVEPLSSVQGRSHFTFKIAREGFAADGKSHLPLKFAVDGEISEGRVDDSRLPEPLTDVEGKIHCDQNGLRVEGLSARCGGSRIDLHAELDGFEENSPLLIVVNAKQLNLDRFPVTTLPVAVRGVWEKFSPQGEVNLNAKLDFDGKVWQPTIKVQCTDLSVMYDKLPYRVREGKGTIELEDDVLTARLRFMAEGQGINCWVDVVHPGPDYIGKIEVQSDGNLQVEENLVAALEDKAQRVVRAFHPKGDFGVYGRVWRTQGDPQEHRKLVLTFQEMSISHDKFRYPIEKLTGTAQMQDGYWVFKNLKGRNDTADLNGSGRWDPNAPDGNQLLLEIVGTDIPIEEELRQALTPGIQQLWTNIRPRGAVDWLKVRLMFNAADHSTSLEIDAKQDDIVQGSSLSIEPVWFRYRLEDLTGTFHFRDGILDMSNLKAKHGATAVAGNGSCRVNPHGGWRLDLKQVYADRVILDNDLITALPEGLSNALVKVGIVDPVNMSGRFGVQMSGEENAQPVLDWNLKLDLDNGRLLLGTAVEHIFGQLAVFGESDSRNIYCRGELQVESAMVRDVQIQHVRGPLWIDNSRLLFGRRAWVKGDVADPIPRQVEGYAFGGEIALDGEVLFDEEGTFEVHPSIEQADLQVIMRELAPRQPTLTGKVFGSVSLTGTSAGMHTWRGSGKVRLIEADIYQLPAMVSMLKILSIQRPEKSAFTNSNMNFDIEGEDLTFRDFDLSGETLGLKGKGRISRHKELDLKFYTQLAREDRQLPVMRPWIGEAGRQFMLIEVTGTLDEPRFNKQVFPRLNERMQLLFPELAKTEGSGLPPIVNGNGGASGVVPAGGSTAESRTVPGSGTKSNAATRKMPWIPWNR